MAWRLGLILALATAVAAEDYKAQLAATDPAARVRAAQALAKSGAAEAVPDLAECLVDESDELRLAAVRALGTAGRAAKSAVPALMRLFSDKNLAIQTAAYLAVARIGEIEVLAGAVRRDRRLLDLFIAEDEDVLRALLGARSWHVRLWVLKLRVVHRSSSAEWIPLLDSLAENDPAEVVRDWALIKLVASRTPARLPPLMRRADSVDARLRAAGVYGISRHAKTDAAVARKLESLLTDPVPQIRARACAGLDGVKAAEPAVKRLLADPEPNVRTAAAVVLARGGTWTEASGALVMAAADLESIKPPFPVTERYHRNLRAGGGSSILDASTKFPSHGYWAQQAILFGGKQAVPFVVRALAQETDEARRVKLVYALGHLRATEALAAVLTDPAQSLRRNAAACRAHLGATDAATVKILIDCLADSPPADEDEEMPIETDTRYIKWPATAAHLLAQIGKPALPALEALGAKAITPDAQRQWIKKLIAIIR